MNTLIYSQEQLPMFTSSASSCSPQTLDQYNTNYFTTSCLDSIETSLLNFSSHIDYKNKEQQQQANFYPSPSTSPLPSEMMLMTPDVTTCAADLPHQYYSPQQQQQQLLGTAAMMMVPPIGQFEPFGISVDEFTSMLTGGTTLYNHCEHKVPPAIELVDQFIAQHQAALEEEKEIKQQPKETSWSYYTYNASSSRDTTPEIVSDLVVVNEAPPQACTTTSNAKKTKKTKVTKGGNNTTGRRGRGKGVKNSLANKKAIAAAVQQLSSSNKTPLEGALYVCQHPDCGRSFTRPYNLTSHLKSHSDERPFACSQCGRKFARQHDRNRHEKLHWGIRPYACHHCHKAFARMDALNRHLRMENGCTGAGGSIHL